MKRIAGVTTSNNHPHRNINYTVLGLRLAGLLFTAALACLLSGCRTKSLLMQSLAAPTSMIGPSTSREDSNSPTSLLPPAQTVNRIRTHWPTRDTVITR